MTIGLCVLWSLAASLVTYAAFAHDKLRAVKGGKRVPEAQLLLLAMVGGWPGAKLAQGRHRHKTRKQPFRMFLNIVPIVWLVLLIMFCGGGWYVGMPSP